MINRRGQGLPMEKFIPAVIAFIVLAVVIAGAIFFDIPGKIRDYFPGLNSTSVNQDLIVNGNIAHYSLGEVKVLLDDGEGRCIVLGYVDDTKTIDSLTGYFGVWKGKLIRKDTSGWADVDSDVANPDQIYLRELKSKFVAAINSLNLNYNGKNYPVSYDSSRGLLANVNGINYAWNGANYVAGVLVASEKLSPEAVRIKFLMVDSLPSIENKKLVFDINPPKDKVIYLHQLYNGKYYGVIGDQFAHVDMVFKIESEISKISEWNLVEEAYITDDREWENMKTKKTIKEDLIKICSSK